MASKQNKHSFSCVVLFDDLIKNECYFDYLGVLVIVLDIKGKIRVFNKKAEEWTGYKKDEVLGKSWIPLFVPKNIRKEVSAAFLEILKGNINKIEDYTNPIVSKDGREIVIRWSNKLIYSSAKEFKGVISTGSDITELVEREKEEKIHAAELERLNSLMVGRELKMIELKERIKELENGE